MESNLVLTEDEQDCLQELMNIAYGSATAAITEILDAMATLSIPIIKVIEVKALKEYLNHQIKVNTSHFVSMQEINGVISGENLFVIDKQSAKNIALKFGLDEQELNSDDLCDIILEITNILSSSTISTLAKEMNTYVSFSPPDISILESINDLDNKFIKDYEKVIIISTELNFNDLNVKGELLVLTTDKSIDYIKEMLNKILAKL
jgi:chemotaxis protein CheC